MIRVNVNMKNIVYMDNAATTSLHPAVLNVMTPYFKELYANPSGNYEFARRVKNDIENARSVIARTIGARPEEIYFTSGGSEGDNWALKAAASERGHGSIVSSNVEHKAVLNSLEYLQSQGRSVTLARADENGVVTADEVGRCIDEKTVLVSVMTANNEIGTIMPIRDISVKNNLRKRGILLHTDSVQAYGHIAIDVNEFGVDMLSASAHKFRGPKGIGFMYIRRDTLETALIHGGVQEMGMRAGTENVALIMGMAKAAQIATQTMKERRQKEANLRNYMFKQLLGTFSNAFINGSTDNRLPNNVNVCFEGYNGYQLVSMLDRYGICASAGSACSSASSKPSHVLKAIGLTDEQARSSVRFTLNDEQGYADVDYVVACLKQIMA
jgi:cysteine desulfurase